MGSQLVSRLVLVVLLGLWHGGCTMDMDKSKAMDMLKKYHYMGEGHPDPAMHGDEMYNDALMVFQTVAGINETGELDEPTMEKMTAKRCGMPDIMNKGDMMKRRRRRKRYVLQGNMWMKGKVSYHQKNFPKLGGLSKTQVTKVIDKAFEAWSEAAKLEFYKLPTQTVSAIEISFESGEHGDDFPFDGPNMTLAHAFAPGEKRHIWGDIHFDDEETWAADGKPGVDLYNVALHELGHSLGLSHSMDMHAIMYPYYPGYSNDLALTSDDIMGIRALYGSNEAPPTPAPVPILTNTTNDKKVKFCESGKVDAAGTLGGMLFVFQGDMYVELDGGGIRSGYPRYIKDDWPGLPDDLDAALAWERHKMILFFKDKQYWRYSLEDGKRALTKGFPRLISDDFKGGLPDEVDAAFVWSKTGDGYIVRDSGYYRLVRQKTGSYRLDRKYHYPKDFASNWNVDLAGGLSEALVYHRRTFFIGDQEYVRYNGRRNKPDNGYPMVTKTHWFGCSQTGDTDSPDMEMDMMAQASQFVQFDGGMLDAHPTTDASSASLTSATTDASSASLTSANVVVMTLIFLVCHWSY